MGGTFKHHPDVCGCHPETVYPAINALLQQPRAVLRVIAFSVAGNPFFSRIVRQPLLCGGTGIFIKLIEKGTSVGLIGIDHEHLFESLYGKLLLF